MDGDEMMQFVSLMAMKEFILKLRKICSLKICAGQKLTEVQLRPVDPTLG